ncbi:SpoIIE family protein phosphatase [Nonomuraea pusilla]|uniref:SpoIIE family protein phosphatase n=1 Tax=Nonomuraea pusilla TaxID=46177 RepID=UPI00331B572F
MGRPPPSGATGTPEERREADLDALTQALEEMLHEIGAHTGALYRLTPDGQTLEVTVMTGLPREFLQPWERVGLRAQIPVADAVREDRLVWVPTEKDMVREYPSIAVALPYEFSLAAVPVSTPGRRYGGVFVVWSGPYPPPPAGTRDRVAAAAAVLGRQLEHLEQIAGQGSPARRDRPVCPPAPSGTAPAEALGAMVARLPEGMATLDARGRLTYVSPKGAALLGESPLRLLGVQPWTVLPWLDDPVYEDRYRRAMISQQPTSFVALRPPGRWLTFELFPSMSGITVRITPAPVEPDLVPERPAPTGVSLPTRAGAIYHVLHLASTLTQAAGVQDVLGLVSDQIMPAFGAQAMVVLAIEEGRLRVLAHRGYPEPIVEQYRRASLTSSTPSVRTMVTGVPGFFESEKELYQLYPSAVAPDDGMSSWALMPLIASGRPIGTLLLAFTEPHPFSVEERAVLTSLGGLIAQALERARLYDAKLELAHGLQEGLLPHALPRVPGLDATARYLPGTEGMDIGGDFYDVIRLPGGSIAAIIGDVQGHNVTAAALMGQVRTAVRAYATTGARPGEVLKRTNHLLVDLDPDLFASCVYVHLDVAARTASLARAGHPQPLLRHPDGRVEVLDLPGGLLLGIDPEAEYPCVELPLDVGAVLALYTDGLIEAPGLDIDDSLAALGGELAHAGARTLDDAAESLMAYARRTNRRSDDVALLLLRLTGEAAEDT